MDAIMDIGMIVEFAKHAHLTAELAPLHLDQMSANLVSMLKL
jgi:hypothetical protein